MALNFSKALRLFHHGWCDHVFNSIQFMPFHYFWYFPSVWCDWIECVCFFFCSFNNSSFWSIRLTKINESLAVHFLFFSFLLFTNQLSVPTRKSWLNHIFASSFCNSGYKRIFEAQFKNSIMCVLPNGNALRKMSKNSEAYEKTNEDLKKKNGFYILMCVSIETICSLLSSRSSNSERTHWAIIARAKRRENSHMKA